MQKTIRHHAPEGLAPFAEHSEDGAERITRQLERIESVIDIPLLDTTEKIKVLESLQRDVARVGGEATDQRVDMRNVWDDMATVVGSKEYADRSVFSPEHLAAQKLYAAGLLETLRGIEQRGEMSHAMEDNFYEAYFSSSDSLVDFVGSYADKLEVFALTGQSRTTRNFRKNLAAAMVYGGTFGAIGSSLREVFEAQKSVEGRLAYISSLNSLLLAAENEIYETSSMQQSLRETLRAVADSSEASVFVKKVAMGYCSDAEQRPNEDWVYIEDLPRDEQEKLLRQYEAARAEEAAEQQRLHQTFPSFAAGTLLRRVASDACASVDHGMLGQLTTLQGDTVDLNAPYASEHMALSAADSILIREAHSQSMLDIVELESGLDLRNISLEAQVRFFRFMAEAGDSQYERLCRVLRQAPDDVRVLAGEVFMAAEFGEDYGDMILSIAEHCSVEQAREIFTTVNAFRHESQKIAKWYQSYDPELASDIEMAMNERLSDSLAALEVLAREGSLDVDTSPGRNSDGYESDGRFVMKLATIDEGVEIVAHLQKSLELIHEIITAGDVKVHRVTEHNDQFVTYRFSSATLGDALLYVRPEGARGYDNQLEYGNREGVEASMSFIVNPSEPHDLTIYKDPHGVSIRFDREGRRTDESPFTKDRDPTRQDGSISLDISSLMGDGRHMPVKIGRFIAAGNILRAAKIGGEASLHHNNRHFDQATYGTAEGFSKLAIYTIHMAEAMIAVQHHGAHASRYQSIPKGLRRAA